MANIKFGNGWADARGKVGGVIYSKNKGGSYARNYTKPTNPRTPAQVAQRNRFSYVSTNWRLLTDPEREAWNYASSQIPVSNKVGEKIHLTGAQYFNRQNLQILAGGGTTLVTTPSQLVDIIGVVSASLDAGVTANAVVSLDLSAILVDGTNVVPTGHACYVYATPMLSAGVTRPQPSAYRLLTYIPASTSLVDFDLKTAYDGTFGAILPDSNVWVSVEVVNSTTGQRSQRFEAKAVYSAVTP
ncbi:MAG: hypothetical protein [Circular genetic element sp.]|nr:MAG: hypothetical protein [Circular genetic element sp.]